MAVPTPTRDLRPLRQPPGQRPLDVRDAQPELEDTYLVALAKRGSADAYDRIVKRYRGFVRLKASSYFLLGGDSDDLIQEGLVGLYKAIRDFRSDRESSFRNFAELCITRQIITAVKTASRNKHAPLNQYVSFAQSPAGATESETTLEEVLPGPISRGPVGARDRHRGAAEPGLVPLERALGPREPMSSPSTSTATPTRRSASAWSATRRRSTTPSSASSARSACTWPRAKRRSRRDKLGTFARGTPTSGRCSVTT